MSQPPILDSSPSPALALDDESLYEVVDGERRETESMRVYETMLASALLSFLQEFLRQEKLGFAATELLFLLDAERNLQRRPDVAVVTYPRWPSRRPARTNAWNVVPDLAVEMISPSNTVEELNKKIHEYFAVGVRLVWIFHPDTEEVYVYESPTMVRVLGRCDELDGGAVLPGFRVKIEAIFEAVTKPD